MNNADSYYQCDGSLRGSVSSLVQACLHSPASSPEWDDANQTNQAYNSAENLQE